MSPDWLDSGLKRQINIYQSSIKLAAFKDATRRRNDSNNYLRFAPNEVISRSQYSNYCNKCVKFSCNFEINSAARLLILGLTYARQVWDSAGAGGVFKYQISSPRISLKYAERQKKEVKSDNRELRQNKNSSRFHRAENEHLKRISSLKYTCRSHSSGN